MFGRDMTLVAEHFDIRGAIGIGHSSGGHTTVQTAAARPQTYRALLLVDPSIFPVEFYGAEPPEASFTLRRRNSWASADEMYQRFCTRAPFVRWRPDILRDYCEYGVAQHNGELVLACPPPVEASIYECSNAPDSNIYADVASVACPVVVLRAGRKRVPGVLDLAASPTAPDLASRFAHARDTVLPEATHFIPMESPEAVAEEIRKLAAEVPA
jgi:pimeloyl-ACP methyl ester carboxylesterase